MDIKQCYIQSGALLEGHFLLSSGNHSKYYLQSAKVLEDPRLASILIEKLSSIILARNINIDYVCSPAIGGIIAGYELARSLGVKFIFTERVGGVMQLRRGFRVSSSDNVLICEDIITTGGSALEAADCITNMDANIIAFAAIVNRGFCKGVDSKLEYSSKCKLPRDIPLFVLEDFRFDIYSPSECPMCRDGSNAIKPGSRGNS